MYFSVFYLNVFKLSTFSEDPEFYSRTEVTHLCRLERGDQSADHMVFS